MYGGYRERAAQSCFSRAIQVSILQCTSECTYTSGVILYNLLFSPSLLYSAYSTLSTLLCLPYSAKLPLTAPLSPSLPLSQGTSDGSQEERPAELRECLVERAARRRDAHAAALHPGGQRHSQHADDREREGSSRSEGWLAVEMFYFGAYYYSFVIYVCWSGIMIR